MVEQYCNGSSFALVRWQNQETEQQEQFRSNYTPVSYEIEEVEEVPDNVPVHAFGTYISKRLRYCNQSQYYRTSTPVISPVSIPAQSFSNVDLVVEDANGLRTIRRINQTNYDNRYMGYLGGLSVAYRTPAQDCPNVNRTYGHSPSIPELKPVNSDDSIIIYKLKITDTRGLVFTKKFDYSPNITVICGKQKCPDNTCEVDCGNHICCYDKKGIAVKTINK